MLGSSGWLLTGETPEKLVTLGEFHWLAVAGEVAGESSVFRLRRVLLEIDGGGGAPMGDMLGGCFLRCERCLSRMPIKPSLVKGFGRTSFMPV